MNEINSNRMKYDFDEIVPRRGTRCVKWDETDIEDVIPMWVADMDFKAAPAIREAVIKRAQHGVYGYAMVPESYFDAVISWFSRRHQWEIKREWISYTTGVVPATSCVINALAMPGEKVIIQTPAYNCFFTSIRNQGCEVLENPLLRDGDSYKISKALNVAVPIPRLLFSCFATLTTPAGACGLRRRWSASTKSACATMSPSSAMRFIANSSCLTIISRLLLLSRRLVRTTR